MIKCLECNELLTQVQGKREKQFCSSTCRSNYWQKAKRRVAENNKPHNKKRILKERNTPPIISDKHKQSQPAIEEMEKQFQKLLKQKKHGN